MNICTIATEDWIEAHLVRWIRCAKEVMPDCKLYLFLVSDNAAILSHEIFKNFEKVNRYPGAVAERTWFNSIRMRATSEFGVDEVLYIDCDADVMKPLDGIAELSKDKQLLWVHSPRVHGQWSELARLKGFDAAWEANNGMLYLRKDWGREYEEAEREVWKLKPDPRIAGTFVFNWMIRQYSEQNCAMPYENSVIWWDVENLRLANCIQYCGDTGQKKRILLEQMYRSIKHE